MLIKRVSDLTAGTFARHPDRFLNASFRGHKGSYSFGENEIGVPPVSSWEYSCYPFLA